MKEQSIQLMNYARDLTQSYKRTKKEEELRSRLSQYVGEHLKVRKGVKKRICRHMHQLGCRDVSTYLLKLDKKEDARLQCEQIMAVSISRFFRDRKLWETKERWEALRGENFAEKGH